MNLPLNTILLGDSLEVLKTLSSESVDCVVTSPPYWALRDYGVAGQLGLETNFQEYVKKLCDIFDEVKRVLKKEGTCWVNIGDTYNGNKEGKTDIKIHKHLGDQKISKKKNYLPNKSLIMIPERFAIEMSERGWAIRNKIIWHKKNAMPSSVVDRLSGKYEIVYLFTKNDKYNFDLDSIRVPFETEDVDHRPQGQRRVREMSYNTKFGTKQRDMEESAKKFGHRRPVQGQAEYERNPKGKNPGDVWTLVSQPNPESHIAMYPEKLIEPMIKAGCPMGGVCLDPFMGAGTTALVAQKAGRNWLGIELNPEYIKIAMDRLYPYLNPLPLYAPITPQKEV